MKKSEKEPTNLYLKEHSTKKRSSERDNKTNRNCPIYKMPAIQKSNSIPTKFNYTSNTNIANNINNPLNNQNANPNTHTFLSNNFSSGFKSAEYFNGFSPKSFLSSRESSQRIFHSSSSQKDIFNRPRSTFTKNLPNINKKKNTLSTSITEQFNNNFGNISNVNFAIEKEQLFYEGTQLSNKIKYLRNELKRIQKETLIKNEMLNNTEMKINEIIINNENNSIHDPFNRDQSNYSKSISNFNATINKLENTITGQTAKTLALKIRQEIKRLKAELKKQQAKEDQLKKNIIYTSLTELKCENELYQDHINDIKSLIENVKKQNQENNSLLNNNLEISNSILKQEKIIKELQKQIELMDEYTVILTEQFNKKNKALIAKQKKIKDNNNNIAKMTIKKNGLYTDKPFNTSVSSIEYSEKIKNLNNLIFYYKSKAKSSEDTIKRLKEQKQRLMENSKQNDILYAHTKIEKIDKTIITNYGKESNEEDTLKTIKENLKKTKKIENKLEKKCKAYMRILKEYDTNSKEKETTGAAEFGLDRDNPYYTTEDDNLPEKTGKFSGNQFNQFTYILFKAFESKQITNEVAQKLILEPFTQIIRDKNIIKLDFASELYQEVLEQFTNIILSNLDADNEYNHKLTKIFIGASICNAECNMEKFIQNIVILFSYTRNYSENEQAMINKIREKYYKQIEILWEALSKEAKDDRYPLLKVKEIIDENQIELKDKYIEFLFYYMRKYNDPTANLGDLKPSLLNEILESNNASKSEKKEKIKTSKEQSDENVIEANNFFKQVNQNENAENPDNQENEEMRDQENIEEGNNGIENINNNNEEGKEEKIKENKDNNIDNNNNSNIKINDNNEDLIKENVNHVNKRSTSDDNDEEVNYEKSPDKEKKPSASKIEENQTSEPKPEYKTSPPALEDREISPNTSNMNENDDDDSMTEITNEEYLKHINDALTIIRLGFKSSDTTFGDFMSNVVQQRKLGGQKYDCVTIEDFMEQLKVLSIGLTDLQLSCLCTKYSVPNELRLLDIHRVEADVNKNTKIV